MPKRIATHGTMSKYNYGCRCELCKAASRNSARSRRDKVKPYVVNGVSQHPWVRHGTYAGYTTYLCRCDLCRETAYRNNKECVRRWRTSNKQYLVNGISTHPKAKHGLYTTYKNYHCRCSSCRKAMSDKRRTYNG